MKVFEFILCFIGVVAAGDVSALIYLWNPMTIVTCLGYSSTPFDNLMVILSIFGACEGILFFLLIISIPCG